MPSRPLVLAAVAFLVGAALSGTVLYEGGSMERAMGAVLGTDARVVLRVENLGTHDLQSSVEVAKAGGATLFADEWVTPEGGVRSRVLEGRLSGDFLVRGQFSWAEGGRRASGDSTVRFSSGECGPGETILVLFRVDSTNGIRMGDGGVSCLAP